MARSNPATAGQNATQAMNVHHAYALTSRADTNQFLRRWTSLSRTAFFGAVMLSDFAVIVTMSWLTGVGYHLLVHGYSGDIDVLPRGGIALGHRLHDLQPLPRRIQAVEFLRLQAASGRSIRLWNVTFICLLALGFLAQVTRRLFARLDAALLLLDDLRLARPAILARPADDARQQDWIDLRADEFFSSAREGISRSSSRGTSPGPSG